jgi:hypothetical protein
MLCVRKHVYKIRDSSQYSVNLGRNRPPLPNPVQAITGGEFRRPRPRRMAGVIRI